MDSPFFRRGNPSDKGAPGRKAERRLADRLGGTQQPGSGALAGAKGDVIKDTPSLSLLIENKSTTGASFGLKRDHLLKVYQEALEQGKTPALAFQFINPLGKSEKRDRWVCLPEHIAMALLNKEEL